MKTPRLGVLTVCLVLAACAATFTLLPASPLTALLVGIFLALLAAELDRSGRHIALRIVYLASRLLPVRFRDDCNAEWSDHVLCQGEAGMRPVFVALWIAFLGAPQLAFRYHVRARVAVYIGRLFLTYADIAEALLLPLRESRPVGNMTIARTAVRSTFALPAATYLYILVGSRGKGCPASLLAGIGAALLVVPYILLVLMPNTPIGGACCIETLMWTLACYVGSRVFQTDDFAARVVARIAGPGQM